MITAIIPWPDQIEDFLDEIDVSLEEFSTTMTGGWLFGYVEALRSQGIESVVFCFSDRVTTTVRRMHVPTGARMVILRVPRAYRRLRRSMTDPYGCSMQAMFGTRNGLLREYWRLLYHIAPYLATPMAGLIREIQRAGCTAIICQEYESPRFDAAIAIGGLLGIPVFATFQGGTWHRSGVERWVRPYTLRRSAGLIIGSSVETRRVKNSYNFDKASIRSIFNPLNSSDWTPVPRGEVRRALGIGDSTRVAMWHGRVDVHRKGLDLLLDAWRRVRLDRSDKDLRLVLVGDGVDAAALDLQIRNASDRDIVWVRDYVLDKAELRRYLCAADVYVLPSRHEGFPVAPLEAMACGLPVVAASAPGVVDIFGTDENFGGLVVPTGDSEALASGILRLIDDETLGRALGQRGRARVEAAFSIEAIGAQLAALLQGGGATPARSSTSP